MTTSKSYLRQNLSLAWPLAANSLLIQSMLMIDTLLVAPLGEEAIAAMGIATAIVAIAVGVGMAIGNGIQLLVGRASGSGEQVELAVAFWAGLFINGVAALLFFLVVVLFGPEFVAALTDDEVVARQVLGYLSILKFIILLTAFTQVSTAFYNGRGNTKIPLIGFLIEIPTNAILSYFLIYGIGALDGLGLVGAAWGSLVAVALRTAYFCLKLLMDADLDLNYPKERPFIAAVRQQFDEIFPIAINFVVLFIGASVYQLVYAQLELAAFVAITLIFPWLRIGSQMVSAWAAASAIYISQALGRRETGHLDDFVSSSVRVGLGMASVVAVLFFLLSQFIHLIYPIVGVEAYEALAVIAPLYIVLPLFRGFNAMSGNILRALGDNKRVLKLNFCGQWVISIPLCMLLVMFYKVSIFWAFAVMLFEELIKLYHFRKYTREKLAAMSSSTTD